MEKVIFNMGLDILESVKEIDVELRKGKDAALSQYFIIIRKIRNKIDCYDEVDELVYDFLGAIINLLIVVNPSNKLLTDRMYQFNMIHEFMELFGDHASVGDKAHISDKNVEHFIEDNGEKDSEKLLNILSQAGEVLSRKNKDRLQKEIYGHLSGLSSATLFFAVTNGIIRIDERIISRLSELCSISDPKDRSSYSFSNPFYVIVKLKLYGYLDFTKVKDISFQKLVDDCWAAMTR